MSAPIVSFSVTAPGFYGLNRQDAPVDMDPKFALEANNCIIDKYGRIGSRKGWTPHHSTSAALGTADVEAIGELIENNGTVTTLCAGNNKLFKVTAGTPNTLTELTYGGGGVAPVITSSQWQMAMLNGVMTLWQRGYDALVYDPALSTTQYRRLSEHPTYAATAPQANAAISAYGRIWAADTSANKNTVYWSDTLTFGRWTGGTAGSLNLYGVWPNGGDEIVALAAHNNLLFIFGKRQILVYSGADNPSNMALSDTLINSGCVARDTVQNTPNDVIYLSPNGVSSIGRTIQERSAPLGNVSKNVNDDVKVYLANATSATKIKAIYSSIDQFYLLSFIDSSITYCFDMRFPLQDGSSRVTTWFNIKPKSFCYCSSSNILRIGLAGYIGNHTGHLDNGATYRLSYFTSWVDFGDPIRTSILKKIIMTIFGSMNQTIVYKWGFDYNSSSGQTQPVTLTDLLPAEYGTGEYGVDEYVSNLVTNSLSVNASGTGKVIQVGFECQVNGRPVSIQRVDIFTKNGAYKA